MAKNWLEMVEKRLLIIPHLFRLIIEGRAVARSGNPGGHIVLGGDNVPPLVEIGLTDPPKSGGHVPPWPPTLLHAC